MGQRGGAARTAALALTAVLAACGGGGGGPVPTASVAITAGPTAARQGDVIFFAAEARDAGGARVEDPTLSWEVIPPSAGLITPDGRFVGYEPGPAAVVASASGSFDALRITVLERSRGTGEFAVVGTGLQTERFTSDLWVHGGVAYTGTWQGERADSRTRPLGDRLLVWDVRDPALPLLTDVVQLDARTANDVKVRADGTLAVVTHEGSSDGRNGITLLDLADPFHPSVLTRFTEELENGVHNVWVEGDHVYAAVNGEGEGLRVIDIADPGFPAVVARFAAETSFLHDVVVRDGLAFLSHWDAGLIILDVGNGIAGGSPEQPAEVSRVATEGGQTHNAWYWPAAGYVFVGEEDFETPGVLHVVDAFDLTRPREVATFAVAQDTPHNFWLDEERGILYVGWYTAGVRAIDVTGELLGELHLQGRDLGSLAYGSDAGCRSADGTCTWAPQLHEGLVYLSDLNTGLWVLEPRLPSPGEPLLARSAR